MKDTRSLAQPHPLQVRIPSYLPVIEDLAAEGDLLPDRLRAVIHQFFLAWVKNERIRKNDLHGDDYKLPGYFPVNAELLKEIASKHYARYVKLLEDHHIIARHLNCNGNSCYEAGKHSTLFTWIKPAHRDDKITFRTEQITDLCVTQAILRTRDNHIKDKMRIASSIEEDYRPVFEQLRVFTEQVVFLPGYEQQYSSDVDDLFIYEVIKGNIKWNTVCSFGNRYHNQITTLPKKSRAFIRFKGYENSRLMMLDFSNSQPYFSSIIGCGKLIEQLLPEFLPVMPILRKMEMKADYLLYRQLCSEGRLYEFFMDTQQMERHEVKGKLFEAVLFANKKTYKYNRLFEKGFGSSFPSVLKMVKEIRKLNEYDLPLLKDIIRPPGVKFKSPTSNYSHKLIPAMMQRAESRIVYRHVVPELIAAGVRPLLTIHDSFILLPEHKETAMRIIVNAFEKFSVIPPNVKCDLL